MFFSNLILATPIFPYLKAGPWHIGPFTIHMFGLMVGIGIIFGVHFVQKRAIKIGINPDYTNEMTTWVIIGGFVVAHLFSIIFYFPERIVKDPLVLLRVWDGISSFGGFLGMFLTIYIYTLYRKVSFWKYLDTALWGGVHGWIFGRMGCSFAHDHPGKFTNSWFSVKWPVNHPDQFLNPQHLSGRHDLGLYELLFTFFLVGLLYLLDRKGKKFPGFITAIVFIAYAPVRFMFDFLRTADKHYWGLTPGQYAAVVMLLTGIGIFYVMYKRNLQTEAIEQSEKVEKTSKQTSKSKKKSKKK